MKNIRTFIILLNLILILIYVNYGIFSKENTLKDGQLVLLELAPVDPRSLIQGDYMSLRYAMAEDLNSNISAISKGYCVLALDSNGVGKKIRLQEKTTPIQNGEYLIKYRKRAYKELAIGAESYFFQEGTAEQYEKAKYGGLRIDQKGNSILVGLYDENKKLIK